MAQQKESNGTWSFYGKLPKDENGKRRNYKRRGFKLLNWQKQNS